MSDTDMTGDNHFDARAFRDVLSNFATGVTIVTAADTAGRPVGMTASSFNSVSMDPPLVLWSVTKKAFSAEVFRSASHFAVHILAADQVELSNRFARSGADKFAGTNHRQDANGVPVLDGVAGRFDCRTWQVYEGGDHWIIVGEVLGIERENKDGLVFSGGTYASAIPIRNTGQVETETAPKPTRPLEELLMYQLARANRQMGQDFHKAVRESGLSVPEWRVLATLNSEEGRDLEDLGVRTFIDPEILKDMLRSLQERDLCRISQAGTSWVIHGTVAGQHRVAQLLDIGREQEQKALNGSGSNGLQQLQVLLKTVIGNTGTG